MANCDACGGSGVSEVQWYKTCYHCLGYGVDIEATQFKDGHWYYRTPEEPEETVGPFMTKTCAYHHAKTGEHRVID